MLRIIFYISFIGLSACYAERHVPVEELRPQFSLHHPQHHYIVREGDTLYAIAFLFGQHSQDLARRNHLSYPYTLKVGQRLMVDSHAEQPQKLTKGSILDHTWGRWQWPTQGQLMASNSQDKIAKKGITIRGRYLQPIYAAQSGMVAYAGHGLPGYGNLILLVHSQQLISAYAFNSKLLVKEGQQVKQGQKIALMGYMSKNIPALHFEVRRRGQTQNPMHYFSH